MINSLLFSFSVSFSSFTKYIKTSHYDLYIYTYIYIYLAQIYVNYQFVKILYLVDSIRIEKRRTSRNYRKYANTSTTEVFTRSMRRDTSISTFYRGSLPRLVQSIKYLVTKLINESEGGGASPSLRYSATLKSLYEIRKNDKTLK